MPRRQEPKKDAANCDKPRGAVSGRGSGDFRMGQPGCGNAQSPMGEHIAHEEAHPGN